MQTNIAEQNETMLRAIAALSGAIKRPEKADEPFPRHVWSAIADTGLFAELIRSDIELNRRIQRTMAGLEKLGEISCDPGLNFTVATHLASTMCALSKFGAMELRERYLRSLAAGELIGAHAISEPHAGSDALAMTTSAVRDGETFVLNGQKAFVTNGPIADLIVVYAKTGEGKAISNVSAFLVPTDIEGIMRGAPMRKVGLETSPLSTLTLRDCRIPASHMLGREGGGFPILSYVMKREILFAFIGTVGEMRRRLDRCVKYANERKQFGVSIGTFQSVSNRIADMKIRYELSRKWLYHVAYKLSTSHDVTSDIGIAKVFVSEAALSTALDAMHIHGADGYLAEHGFGDAITAAAAGPIYSGTNDIQRNRIAAMLGVIQ
jgi:alkylation response protein AidB-like acyl-CoA dehydrogenase